MKRRPLFLLLFALVCGALSAKVALGVMQQKARSATAPGAPSTRIAVATRDLPGGTILRRGDLRMVAWPSASVPSGFLASPDAAIGQGLKTPLQANEPVLSGKLAGRGVSGLPSVIPEGMRAASVRVDDVTAVAGFVVPGTRVDVLVTLPRADDRPSVTRSILQNVQVLASGQSLQPTDNGKAQETTVITLLLTPEQTELLTLASNEGRIQLALRNTLDESVAITAGAHLGRLGSGRAAPRPAAEAPARPAASPHHRAGAIEVYNGSTRTVATF